MNLTNLLLLFYTIPVYGFFQLYTDNFACLKFQGTHVPDRISGIYEQKDEVSQILGSIKRVSKIEQEKNEQSNILLLELHNIDTNMGGSCGFLAMGNISSEITIFSSLILSYPDIRSQAYAEISDHIQINPVYISNKQWYLDYLFIHVNLP